MPRPWFTGWPSRFLVADLYGETTAFLDKLVLDASLAVNLNQPFQGSVSFRPNDPRVNRIFHDGYPLVAQSNRVVYVFFDENPPGGFECRLAGVFMQPEDQADADVPTSHFSFFDPWMFLNGTPVFFNDAGTSPGPDGAPFWATHGNEIVCTLLARAIAGQPPSNPGQGGNGYFIDAGDGSRSGEGPQYQDWGGTAFYTGTLEQTPVIDYNAQQGGTVGQAWTELLAAGSGPGLPGFGFTVNDGIDIVLTAIYDPVNRPGYTHELSIYNSAGSERPSSPMAWGGFNRTAATADRQHDATPGNFVNVAQGFAGQGGPGNTPIVNAGSVNDFLTYYQQKFFPSQPNAIAVQAMMQQIVTLTKQGKRTFTVNPDPLRAVQPFVGYTIGDRIPILTPDTLRVASTGFQRVQGIPLSVGSDGVTRVNALLTSPDWRGDDA